ncbi:beta-galactosidase-like [Melanaphis sacchari]|uniref:beta-galactosidase-like n=1 Tax=Melanaphis sacchari TaxID=742174 RepID=UPI000DC13634|nr:beta-galactosidase-like [Melanaphis sacchari]
MHWIGVYCFLSLFIYVLPDNHNPINKRTFIVDYEKNEFLKDGEVFRYISGDLHYFRIPKLYWKDRIQKIKAAGLNAITTYVEWSLHEPFPGIYNFEGMADLEYFIKLIQDEGMYLLLRPGPYICAERDFGGFPYWILNVTPKRSLRTNDSSFKKYVSKWFSVLMPKVQPYLYGNGGNIIMVQVENEYGSYYACDSDYKLWLRDLFKGYVENKALLYTVDMCQQSSFDCGSIPEVYATVDFGISKNASECFNLMKKFQKGGPPVNSEFYPGWLAHWQEPHPKVNSSDVVRQMKSMLSMNASFSFYMFHGGTNFGFTSGANTNDTNENIGYIPQLTSYDYDAPLTEAGDLTEKYFKIKQTLDNAKYSGTNDTLPTQMLKAAYGVYYLQPLVSIFETVTHRIEPVSSVAPITFEDMDINTGFVMYETILLNNKFQNPVNLTVNSVRDRAIIYLDQVQVGTMNRLKANTTILLNINNNSAQKLSILIENQGRINYGDFMEDRKGILGDVILENTKLGPWKMIAHPLNETSWLSSIKPVENVQVPAFYKTQFSLPENYTNTLDTYLDTSGWTKGVVFLNDKNLGRYWPLAGPQVTLYVPATFLKPPPNINTLVMFELENAPQDLAIKFVDKPILNGPIQI